MISIIVPVYNVEKYLSECLESIQKQSIFDWECILIDDGSKDKSGEICDHWAEKDDRFKIIHQKNKGVSNARNNGINLAQGEFICFIDSDDWIEFNYLENLLSAIEKNADLAVSGINLCFDNRIVGKKTPSKDSIISLDIKDIEDFTNLNSQHLLFGPCAKLFRSSILKEHKIQFPIDCAYGEDLQFNYLYLDHVHSIAQTKEANYNYRIIGSGTLSTKIRPQRFEQDYEQWKFLKDFHIKHNLWNESSKKFLYNRLWGIIYDGLFSTNTNNKIILSIPEITELKEYQHVFKCSKWIKFCILNRLFLIFNFI